MMRVAVIGGGRSGLAAAYILAKEGAKVVVYEKEDRLGGEAKTPIVDGIALHLGLMSFSRSLYPDVMELFEKLGVDMEACDTSFSVSLDEGQGFEWGTRNGLSSLFAQKKNVLNPWFWEMIREIIKFKHDASTYIEELNNNPDIDRDETLGHFIQSRGYSELFQKAFLIPFCSSIWSCSSVVMVNCSAYLILSFLLNHDILELLSLPEGLTSKWCSQSYVNKVKKELESRGCQVKTNSEVSSILTSDTGCAITCKDGLEEAYDGCVIAAHAPNALEILGKQATDDELRILGAFQYAYSDIFLHHDDNFMPKIRATWSWRNFLGTTNDKACITYWLNIVQDIREAEHGVPFLLTLNPLHTPKDTLCKWSTSHLIPSVAASRASFHLNLIQGKRGLWFCGSYQGYGFPEDGVKAGILAANGLLQKHSTFPNNPKFMIPSCLQSGARVLVTRFLHRFITTGCLILLEEGSKILTFEGKRKHSNLKVTLRVHKPQFYWKVATEGDLGFADSYIDGDISFVDANEGLLNFLLLIITNREMNNHASRLNKKRGWWTQQLYTSVIGSTKSFFKHVSRMNSISQARRNISRHYDLSNEMFSLFLDETMTYSCAIFQNPSEDLKSAQIRKLHTLIDKARINKDHHILEIGCGWGSLALEVVKKTGCKYTGITLSEKQLLYIESKVREAGLQDQIEVLLCDYRQLPNNYKYDRIISWNRRNNRNGARDDEEDRADLLPGARVAQYAPPREEDSWNLQASDNPGMQLVSVKLEGNNFNTWCRSIKIALGAKVKLGFIDGRTRAPALDSETYDEWKKTDCMVISWILNSISRELVESFVYMDSAKQLWDVLCERFGECNGPMIYELKRQIATYCQGSQTVMVYYNNLNKMWDELTCLLPTAMCTCADGRVIMERQQNDKLMQFLMGLNDVFEAVRGQILILDPLPSVNKAYSMVLRVEKQKKVSTTFPEMVEFNAMLTQAKGGYTPKTYVGKESAGSSKQQGYKPRLSKEEKSRLKCEHCRGSGHEVSECFKLHGYPDWFKKLKDQKRKEHANMTDTPQHDTHEVEGLKRGHFLSNPEMGSLITEIARNMGTHPLSACDGVGTANYAFFSGYAGPEE